MVDKTSQGTNQIPDEVIRKTIDDFRDRESKVGRARIFSEKSIGLDDPGMLAFQRMFEAIN